MYRDILVHIKPYEEWSAHVDYAIGVAASLGARLRGLAIFSEVAMMRNLTRRDSPKVRELEARDAKRINEIAAEFKKAAQAKQVECVFATADGRASEIVTWLARFHDLSVIEQRDPRKDDIDYDAAEEATLAAGRPIILVPRMGAYNPDPRHILLAWNGSRQAAAALHGALPFIDRASKVTCLLGQGRDRFGGGTNMPELGIEEALRRRVKEVAVDKIEVADAGVGDYLLDRAAGLKADLLVMGAYGRSWFSEFAFGGATRHVFRHATLPILMGH